MLSNNLKALWDYQAAENALESYERTLMNTETRKKLVHQQQQRDIHHIVKQIHRRGKAVIHVQHARFVYKRGNDLGSGDVHGILHQVNFFIPHAENIAALYNQQNAYGRQNGRNINMPDTLAEIRTIHNGGLMQLRRY